MPLLGPPAEMGSALPVLPAAETAERGGTPPSHRTRGFVPSPQASQAEWEGPL